MDEDFASPRLEAVWVAQCRELSPDGDEGALQGVLGEMGVAQDPHGERVHRVAGQLDQRSECFAIASLCPFDEISHRLAPYRSATARCGTVWS
jgi:hypothetical protein